MLIHQNDLSNRDTPPSVMLVCRHAIGLFYPQFPRSFGGAETRAVTFAQGLAEQGFATSFLLRDYGQPTHQVLNGINVWSDPNWLESAVDGFAEYGKRINGFPWVRIHKWGAGLGWQLPVLAHHAICRRLDCWCERTIGRIVNQRPDVVCAFGVSDDTADVVHTCGRFGIPSVILIASDHNIDSRYLRDRRYRGRFGEHASRCVAALQGTDRIVVQSKKQQELLRKHYGRDSILIKNPIRIVDSTPDRETSDGRNTVLWIGRADTVQKHPARCITLAHKCPEVFFEMIMNRKEPGVFEQICQDAPSNVTIIESVPHDQMVHYFQKAKICISTSSLEGMPNALLQAAKCETPIVSLNVDPDGFISGPPCGLVAGGDLDVMASQIRELWNSPQLCRRYGTSWP